MSVPRFLQPYLASYNLSLLSLKGDRDIIITQVLNSGDAEAIRWLLKFYTNKEIKEVLEKPTRGMWFRQSLSYWLKIYDVKISKSSFEISILDLNPRPRIYEKVFVQDVLR